MAMKCRYLEIMTFFYQPMLIVHFLLFYSEIGSSSSGTEMEDFLWDQQHSLEVNLPW